MLQNVKSLLIGLTEEGDEAEVSSALGYGLSMARQAGAHATVQAASVKLILTHAVVSSIAAGLVSAENRRLNALAEAAAENARQEAASAGIACTTLAPQLAYPDLIRTFTDLARVHDMTILDAEPVSMGIDRGVMEQVLFESGRPVLIVPPGTETFSVRRVVVAWDGSAKAARALNDALPLLRTAELVEVVTIGGEKDLSNSMPGAEVAPHLARHGANVVVSHLVAEAGDAAETLRNHATLTGAEMIVMGAYVHSRLRQMVLGGMTHALLKSSPLPLFMSY